MHISSYSHTRGKKKILNPNHHTLQSETANRKCYAAEEIFALLQSSEAVTALCYRRLSSHASYGTVQRLREEKESETQSPGCTRILLGTPYYFKRAFTCISETTATLGLLGNGFPLPTRIYFNPPITPFPSHFCGLVIKRMQCSVDSLTSLPGSQEDGLTLGAERTLHCVASIDFTSLLSL